MGDSGREERYVDTSLVKQGFLFIANVAKTGCLEDAVYSFFHGRVHHWEELALGSPSYQSGFEGYESLCGLYGKHKP